MLSLQILQHKQRVTKEEAYSFIGLLPEADLGEGSRGSGPPPPPPFIPNICMKPQDLCCT